MDMKHDTKPDHPVDIDAKTDLAPARIWQPEALAIAVIVALLWIMVIVRFALSTSA